MADRDLHQVRESISSNTTNPIHDPLVPVPCEKAWFTVLLRSCKVYIVSSLFVEPSNLQSYITPILCFPSKLLSVYVGICKSNLTSCCCHYYVNDHGDRDRDRDRVALVRGLIED